MPISTLKRQLMTMIIVKMWIESIYKKEQLVQALLLKLLNKTIIKPHRHVVYGVCLFLYSMLKIIID